MPELVSAEDVPVEAQLFPTLPKERCVVQDFTLDTTCMSPNDRQRADEWVGTWMERPQRGPILQEGKAMPNLPLLTLKEAMERLAQRGMYAFAWMYDNMNVYTNIFKQAY